jgi:hypothetical protein
MQKITNFMCKTNKAVSAYFLGQGQHIFYTFGVPTAGGGLLTGHQIYTTVYCEVIMLGKNRFPVICE